MFKRQHLIDTLIRERVLHTPVIIDAFQFVDRRDFVGNENTESAYEDTALPIGYGQTISQPFTVAFMLELLMPKRGEKVLVVGSGSGWTTALLAAIVGETGEVKGVELVPRLVEFGQENLAKYSFRWAEILLADDDLGLPKAGPFDRILVSAAADHLPEVLVHQLKPGGVMVIPVHEAVWRVSKEEDETIEIEKYEGFVFVPLIEQ